MSRAEYPSSQTDVPTAGAASEDPAASAQHNRGIADSSNGGDHGFARPRQVPRDHRLAEAERQTRRLARSHYENFVVASILLPRRLRQPFYNVYAFCRTADDAADESASSEVALLKLDHLQSQLNAIFTGEPAQGLFLALSATVSEFQLDQQPFDDLLDAFRQDQRTTRYQTFDQILDYCQRSANPVGRIVLALVNCLDEENARLSDSICTGLQLANFLQDVASDFRRGRIYLAADQMSRFGVQESMFGAQQTTLALRQLLASECDRAEEFLRRGMPLSRRVPPWFAADVRLFAQGGLATLAAIRRIDYDVLRVRPTVSKLKQLALLLRASLVRF